MHEALHAVARKKM